MTPNLKLRNSFEGLASEADDEDETANGVTGTMAVDPAKALASLSSIEFSMADLKTPLASAATKVKNGNRVILYDEG